MCFPHRIISEINPELTVTGLDCTAVLAENACCGCGLTPRQHSLGLSPTSLSLNWTASAYSHAIITWVLTLVILIVFYQRRCSDGGATSVTVTWYTSQQHLCFSCRPETCESRIYLYRTRSNKLCLWAGFKEEKHKHLKSQGQHWEG